MVGRFNWLMHHTEDAIGSGLGMFIEGGADVRFWPKGDIGAMSGVQLAGGCVEFVWRRCHGALI